MNSSASNAVHWRHELHQIPETAFKEHATSRRIAEILASLGVEVTTGVGGTGVVGKLTRGDSPRALGLRADMDALPLRESTGLAYSSTHEGNMHACGHDGHMAMVLGAAEKLVAGTSFDGTVYFVFQPAEEPGKGAAAMISDGLLERFPMDAMFGLHNIPGVPAGTLATRPGALMAGEDNFSITITGRGGHASAPHLVTDPLVIAAQTITALQSIVARNIDPLESAVVSCTNITTDGARNAIPTTVTITGDTRNFDVHISEILEHNIRQLAEQTAEAYGATAEVAYTREFATTKNDAEATRIATAAAIATVGAASAEANAAPIMASEDFGLYADHVPANFTFIGNGVAGETGGTPLHSHDYIFNDEILPVGIAYYCNIVDTFLANAPERLLS